MLGFRRKKPASPARRNVVVVLVDMVRNDARAGRPIFDELGRRGVCFSEMYTYAPYTIASIHALMSGMYGSLTGVDAYYKAPKFDGTRIRTLAEHFHDNGYLTLADFMNPGIAPHQGFDEVRVHDEFKDDLTTRHIAMIEEARSRVAAGEKKNHFLYLHFSPIHREVVTRVIKVYSDFDERYFGPEHVTENRRRYDSFVDIATEYLEALVARCDALGAFRDTIFVFMTDHGCGIGEKPGEKAYGIFTYDYTIRTWAYFIQPDVLPGGREITTMVRTIDIAPTLLELCDIVPREGEKEMQGESLLPLMRGEGGIHREIYVETAGLDGPTPSPYEANIFCVRNRRWKMIYNATTKIRELYDMQADPTEAKNLAGTLPEVENELFEKIRRRCL